MRNFTIAQWDAYPKDGFDKLIRRWCERHDFMQYVELGTKVPTKLPYHKKASNDDIVEVASDFIALAEQYRVRAIFQPPLPKTV
jgi:hypothetical protein